MLDSAPPFGDVETLARLVDAYMGSYGKNYGPPYQPSGMLVISHHGRPVFSRGYGRISQDNAGVPDAFTRFRIGSITKSLVAVTALSLIKAEKLSASDSIRKFVPELPASYQPVTLHHLLSQTSGVPNLTNDPQLLARKGQAIPKQDLLAFFGKNPPDFLPGTRFLYSNSNYYLVGLALEAATGRKLDDLIREHVFVAAGMPRSGPDARPDDAVGSRRGPQGDLVAADLVDNAIALGSGHLRSTAADLMAFGRALDAGQLVGGELADKLSTPVSGGYAYGFVVGELDGREIVWHNGAIDGYQSFFARAPKAEISVVYLGNVFDFDATRVGMDVLKMALTATAVTPPEERPLSVIDEIFGKSLVGDFVLEKASRAELVEQVPAPVLASIEGIALRFDGGALTGKPVGQGTFSLLKAADGVLFNPSLKLEISLPAIDTNPAKNIISGFTLTQGSLKARYVRGALPAKKKR